MQAGSFPTELSAKPVYTKNGILFSFKKKKTKKKIMPIVTAWKNLQDVMPSDIKILRRDGNTLNYIKKIFTTQIITML